MNPSELFGTDTGADVAVDDPLDLLDMWLSRVGAAGATDSTTTPLMALATLDASGAPRVRHVLLSSYDHGRLHFHTDARSAKAEQLAADDRAAATIVWPDLPRQLGVSGRVIPESAEEAVAGFAARSRYLQMLAWVNGSDLVDLTVEERSARWNAFDAEHPTLEPPPTWAGYALEPTLITFWRGASSGPSQRVQCVRDGAGWTVERLPG